MTRERWTQDAIAPVAWYKVDGSGEPVDMLFDGAPYATPEAIAAFPPPPIGYDFCLGCGEPNRHETWTEAENAGWYAGTGCGPGGYVLFCPPCADDYQRNNVEPEPR